MALRLFPSNNFINTIAKLINYPSLRYLTAINLFEALYKDRNTKKDQIWMNEIDKIN